MTRKRSVITAVLIGVGVPGLVGPSAQECALTVHEWAPRGSAQTARPRISATFESTCGAAIDISSIRMTMDDEEVRTTTDGTGSKVTVIHTPQLSLVEEADHTVTVHAQDEKGVKGEKRWTFYVADVY